jgi:hypothetical protein
VCRVEAYRATAASGGAEHLQDVVRKEGRNGGAVLVDTLEDLDEDLKGREGRAAPLTVVRDHRRQVLQFPLLLAAAERTSCLAALYRLLRTESTSTPAPPLLPVSFIAGNAVVRT